MRKFILLLICIFFDSFAVFTQSSLYMPLNFQEAYKKGTRSYNGIPGPNYWQNHSDYSIKTSIDPASDKLSGSENVTYHNNSPDTLDQLVIRLYQNINRLGNAHDFPFD